MWTTTHVLHAWMCLAASSCLISNEYAERAFWEELGYWKQSKLVQPYHKKYKTFLLLQITSHRLLNCSDVHVKAKWTLRKKSLAWTFWSVLSRKKCDSHKNKGKIARVVRCWRLMSGSFQREITFGVDTDWLSLRSDACLHISQLETNS